MRAAGCLILALVASTPSARADTEELHVFGVSATSPSTGRSPKSRARVEITIDRKAPQTLVLGAYQSTEWVITVAKGGQLRRVIATGYQDQIVRAPAGVKVETFSGEGHYLSASGAPGWGGGLGSGAAALVTAAEELTGLSATTYHGCMRATAATQTAGGTFTADCTDGQGPTLHKTAVVHALPPLLPPIADSEVRFRARLVGRCGSWDASTCASEGAILVVDKDARIQLELGGKLLPPRILPTRVPPKTTIAIVRDGKRQPLQPKPGEVWLVRADGTATRHADANSDLQLAGDADVLSQIVGAVGGAMCMGSCALHRDHAGLFTLLDWLSTFEDLPITDLSVVARS